YSKLLENKIYSTFLLKLMGTLVYDSLERWSGFTKALRGNRSYINELDRVVNNSDFVFKTAGARWIVFFLSLGGRIGRKQMALLLRRKHIKMISGTSLS